MLCSYLVDSLSIGSHREVRSIKSIPEKCQAKMKAMYAKHLNANALNATHNVNVHHNSDTEEEYPVDDESLQVCPLEPLTGLNDRLSDRSLCPWYTIVNHDELRYPQDLIEVKCRCQECIQVPGNACERVYNNVPVVRYDTRKKGSCQSRLRRSWQRISVACTCARIPIF